MKQPRINHRLDGALGYAKHHHFRSTLALLIAIGVVTWIWASTVVALPSFSGQDARFVTINLLMPLVAAVCVARTFAAVVPAVEATASINFRLVRLGHILAMLTCCLLVFLPSWLGWTGQTDHGAAIRNSIGYVGLASVSGALLGPRFSWILPITWALLAAMYAASATTVILAPVAWPVDARMTVANFTIATFCCMAGIVATVARATAASPGLIETDVDQ